jgi:hypothetical protein
MKDERDWQDRIPLWGWDLLFLACLIILVVIALGKARGWWT